MTADELVSVREFARRHNAALSSVQKAITSGRITAVLRTNSGRLAGIYARAAAIEWASRTDPAQSARARHNKGIAMDTTSAAGQLVPEAVFELALQLALPASVAIMMRRGLPGEASLAVFDELLLCVGLALEEILGRELEFPSTDVLGQLLDEEGRARLLEQAARIEIE